MQSKISLSGKSLQLYQRNIFEVRIVYERDFLQGLSSLYLGAAVDQRTVSIFFYALVSPLIFRSACFDKCVRHIFLFDRIHSDACV